jgi:hypothetical protein
MNDKEPFSWWEDQRLPRILDDISDDKEHIWPILIGMRQGSGQ